MSHIRTVIIGTIVLFAALSAHAQSPTELATCLQDNTSGRDRKDLAKWMFLAMASHSELKPYVTAEVPPAADESSRRIAALVTRLITDTCVDQVKAGGKDARLASLQVAFGKLGELAMKELMADEAVSASLSSFERYLDEKRFEALSDSK